jgi:hypothetical protein
MVSVALLPVGTETIGLPGTIEKSESGLEMGLLSVKLEGA